MPGTHDARERLLDAAVGLLREGGLDAATPAAVAERAGAGKMSVYRHFAGKDELVAEALARRDGPHRAWLLPEPTAGAADADRVEELFLRAAARADLPGYIGCPYARTGLELAATGDDHPAAAVARDHKTSFAADLEAIVGDGATARAIAMLFDGAVVHAVMQGDGTPLREAADVARRLVP